STGGRQDIEAMEAGLVDEEETPAPVQMVMDVNNEDVSRNRPHGNLALSSCPGKKVRLNTGPVNGRAAINRDLAVDFERLASFQIRTVVCCLNDAELNYLGAPWQKYLTTAHRYGMDVVRLPIVEGSCPESMEDVEVVMEVLERRVSQGANVLVHCRGGVGRAGLIACCFLIRRRYVVSAERAVQFVRLRRSLKAIETARQEDFVTQYFLWCEQRRQISARMG
ncbi:hypothetical protein HDU76_004974, partial [Blyttiomyces sp. JEL0837]